MREHVPGGDMGISLFYYLSKLKSPPLPSWGGGGVTLTGALHSGVSKLVQGFQIAE
jgi:hypothetical protein